MLLSSLAQGASEKIRASVPKGQMIVVDYARAEEFA
jgi:hypothetical protein